MEHIRIGKEEDKARVLTGGERWGKEGYYIKPTIFTDVKTGAWLPFCLLTVRLD
jgi:aldehyde dehydrogenase (NAD+)